MKDKNFIIKVGDLLQEWGKTDSISFNHKSSSWISNLANKWISWTVNFHSLNQDSLYVSLEDISCEINEICDRCWISYVRKVNVPSYVSRFVLNEKIKQEEEQTSDEEIFLINTRDETIDIEPMIIQSIFLEEPFVKHCQSCEKEIINDIDWEDIEGNFLWNWNIIFH